MNTTATTGSAPETLRADMVDRIKTAGYARTPAVEDALRTIPRHEFVPEATVEVAYDVDTAVITKRADTGAALSCASVPTIVAMMLDQLEVQPGQRILEIGAGTGYNAALLAYLTGPSGHVTTVDIDPEVTAGARRGLDATGHPEVEVITRDGAIGAPENAPYDRIIVTVGAWDLPQTWRDQLAPGGRLVVPLRWRGQTRSVAFTHQDGVLRAETTELCGFVPMIGQEGERSGYLDQDNQVALYFDADQPINLAALEGVLAQPKATTWCEVTLGPTDPVDGLWLTLTANEPGTCRIAAERAAVDSGLCTPVLPMRSPAIVEGDSLAYLAARRLDDHPDGHSELGAIGHGPNGQELADRLCNHIHGWNQDRAAQPHIDAYPAGVHDNDLEIASGVVIDKPESRLVFHA
jgi:protein-L-isoaspartate(D-aspartate) O-methyltransferase